MSGLLRSSTQSQASAAVLPMYTGLQLQTATNTLPIPIVYGMNKLGSNVIYYNNFKATPVYSAQRQSGGKGGIFGSSSTSSVTYQIVGWNYSADILLGLCEGEILTIGQVWSGQATSLFSNTSPNPNGFALNANNYGLGLISGTQTQLPWGYLPVPSSGVGYNLSYSGTAYLTGAGFNLGSSASIGTLTFEVCGVFYASGWNGMDADPASVIYDFLTNPQYGIGYEAGLIDGGWLFNGTGSSSVQNYCWALGLAFSPVLTQIESASSILTRWCQILNVGAVRSGGLLRFIPYGDTTIEGNGVVWVPPITPVYNLTDDSFVHHDGEDPIYVTRVDPLSLYTVQCVEVLNRAGVNVNAALVVQQMDATLSIMETIATRGLSSGGGTLPQPQGQPQYQAVPVFARDLSAIQSGIGLRVAPTITLHEICDINIAATVAQIILQRGLYIRTTYEFTLPWTYCLLDPMDIVTINDANLGLANKTVRITEIAEQPDGTLNITAEDLTIGVSTPAPNISTGSTGSAINSGATPAPIDTYFVWEPPILLTNGTPTIAFGASGGVAGVPDPNWGGCNVWVSFDGGTTYSQIGSINAPIGQGTLTADYASNVGYDTTDVLSVNMAETGTVLTSTTAINAQSGLVNVCLIGSEIISFSTATLTSTGMYDLTGIQRGCYGSTPALHTTGTIFTDLDNVIVIPLFPQTIGATVYFKFQSFNIYGSTVQDISTCLPYGYTISGSGYNGSNQLGNNIQTVTMTGASVTTPAVIPVGAWVTTIAVEVMVAITGTTSFNVDPQYNSDGTPGGTGGALGNCNITLGSAISFDTAWSLWTVTSGIVLTPVGGSFTAGSVRVTVTYITAA